MSVQYPSRRPSSRVAGVFLCTLALSSTACDLTIVRVDDAKHLEQRDAILILPGLGYDRRGHDAIDAFFARQGYDLLVPDYASSRGLAASVENVRAFLDEVEIERYRDVHALTFVMGTWTLNLLLDDYPFDNLRSIVYGRSPLQERAPRVLAANYPEILWRIVDESILAMAETPYPPLPRDGPRVGIIVENRATPLVRRYRNDVLALGPVSWDLADLDESSDDHLYTPLDHDRMYYRFDVTGDEILHFFAHGRFSPDARRTPLEGDPFAPVRLPDPSAAPSVSDRASSARTSSRAARPAG